MKICTRLKSLFEIWIGVGGVRWVFEIDFPKEKYQQACGERLSSCLHLFLKLNAPKVQQ